MESFTLVDAAVALVIVVSAILAYSRGLLREILAIAGWIVAAVVAFVLAPTFEPLVREIPYLGQILGDSCELTIIASFAGVFAIMLMIVATAIGEKSRPSTPLRASSGRKTMMMSSVA